MRDQYYNMREKVEPVKHVIDYARKAMEEVGITPSSNPFGRYGWSKTFIHGFTMSQYFAGMNFHGKYEYLPIPSMKKASKVIVKIAEVVAREAAES